MSVDIRGFGSAIWCCFSWLQDVLGGNLQWPIRSEEGRLLFISAPDRLLHLPHSESNIPDKNVREDSSGDAVDQKPQLRHHREIPQKLLHLLLPPDH